jgi:hypothetical protein
VICTGYPRPRIRGRRYSAVEYFKSWTRTGSLMSELGLYRGEMCDELGQVMYIGVSHEMK